MSEYRKSLQDFSFDELKTVATELGVPSFRAAQIFDMALRHKQYDEVTNLPKGLIEKLNEKYAATALTVVERYVSRDGTAKYLYRLTDGNVIEGVFMPHNYGDTLCVSTQVGCRMGCAFCASGIGGLVRSLSAGEILAQVLAANRLNGGTPEKRAVTNIVLMGSGEPLDNYDNVMRFLDLVSAEKGLNVSLRNISLSTVGLADKIRELADSGKTVTLTISLHAPTDEKRAKLIPMNAKFCVSDIMNAAKYYFDKTHRRIIFEYALVDGVNADKTSALELVSLVRGMSAHINLIKLNYVKEKGLPAANADTVKAFLDTLTENGVSATVRRSMGADIAGACGQLRRKYLDGEA